MSGECSLRLTRRYAASPAEVWGALTDPTSMGRWLAAVRHLDLSPSGSIELDVMGQWTVAASVRQLDPGRLLEIDWCPPDEERSIVRFELRAHGLGTLLVLEHVRIAEQLGMRYMTRWTAALRRLERALHR